MGWKEKRAKRDTQCGRTRMLSALEYTRPRATLHSSTTTVVYSPSGRSVRRQATKAPTASSVGFPARGSGASGVGIAVGSAAASTCTSDWCSASTVAPFQASEGGPARTNSRGGASAPT